MELGSDFSDDFRRGRLHLGLTQEQAAQRIGVSKTTVQNWESGRTEPRYGELLRVFVAFGWVTDKRSRKSATARERSLAELAMSRRSSDLVTASATG